MTADLLEEFHSSSLHFLCCVGELTVGSIVSDTVLHYLLQVNQKLFSTEIMVTLTVLQPLHSSVNCKAVSLHTLDTFFIVSRSMGLVIIMR